MTTINEIHEATETNRKGYEHVLDYVANFIVRLALFFKITPTQLTWFWVIFQFFTPFLFLTATYSFSVLAVVLFQLMFLIDLSDGKLARFYRSIPSVSQDKLLFPKYLDRVGHFVNDALLFVCLGIGTTLRFQDTIYMYVGFAAAAFFLLNKAVSVNPAWYKSLEEQSLVATIFHKSIPRSSNFKFKQFLFDFLRVEHLFNFLFVGIVTDQPRIVLAVYGLLFFFEFLRKLYVQGKCLYRIDKERK